jgi:SOS-response transcriptional repressor LexA
MNPASGDIAAVVFRDEDNRASLKRIQIEARKVVLRPESSNPEHQPRVLPPEAFVGDNPTAAIIGIAIAVLKPQPSKALGLTPTSSSSGRRA